MKKFLITITVILSAAITVCGQSLNAGYLNSSYIYNGKNSATTTTGNGLYAGIENDFNILPIDNSSISAGVYFDFVNYRLSDYLAARTFSFRIPVHFKYSIRLGAAESLFVSAVPSASVGAFGNYVTTIGSTSHKEDFYGDDNSRFDLSLGAKAGIELSRSIRVSVGYDFGLLNQGPKNSVVNRNFLQAGVGYIF
jgi:hypothetical protein